MRTSNNKNSLENNLQGFVGKVKDNFSQAGKYISNNSKMILPAIAVYSAIAFTGCPTPSNPIDTVDIIEDPVEDPVDTTAPVISYSGPVDAEGNPSPIHVPFGDLPKNVLSYLSANEDAEFTIEEPSFDRSSDEPIDGLYKVIATDTSGNATEPFTIPAEYRVEGQNVADFLDLMTNTYVEVDGVDKQLNVKEYLDSRGIDIPRGTTATDISGFYDGVRTIGENEYAAEVIATDRQLTSIDYSTAGNMKDDSPFIGTGDNFALFFRHGPNTVCASIGERDPDTGDIKFDEYFVQESGSYLPSDSTMDLTPQ